MVRHSCDGAGLLDAVRAAVANLEAHVDEVNALNVYPVPDGDTGSNMLATVRTALAEAESVTDGTADRIAAAISFGALMGARGNSGVILSQIVRGMSEGLEGRRRFNGLDLAHALTVGNATAYRAVGRPVEGTILTVIREASTAAVVAGEHDNDVHTVLAAAVEAAERAVARTPSLLPILHDAGVVDAGGQGLFRLLEGALRHVSGATTSVVAAGQERAAARPSAVVAHADEGFGYETMFLVQAAAHPLDLDQIRDHLGSIGQSVLVAGDSRAAKVHVHNERPDQILAYGLSLGTLSRISVENLDAQARDVRETRAAQFAGEQRTASPGVPSAAAYGASTGAGLASVGGRAELPGVGQLEAAGPVPHALPEATAAPRSRSDVNGHIPLAVVAVAPGDGLGSVFESFGVSAIVAGGQANNPSTGELLAAVEALDAEEVLLLPNNPNVLLAARQVSELTERSVAVVPTRNAAEGIAALLALDPTRGAAENVDAMTKAGRAIQTVQVTEAVRDAAIGGRKVKKGQTIVLDPEEGLIAADNDREKAVRRALETFAPGFELVTVYYGDGADLKEAEGIARLLGEWRPGLEVEVVRGGQPHYRYLISAE